MKNSKFFSYVPISAFNYKFFLKIMNSTPKGGMIGIHLGSHSGHAIHSFHKIILLGYPIDPELSTSLWISRVLFDSNTPLLCSGDKVHKIQLRKWSANLLSCLYAAAPRIPRSSAARVRRRRLIVSLYGFLIFTGFI